MHILLKHDQSGYWVGLLYFTNLGLFRRLKGKLLQRHGNDFHNLLGLIHGHYDVKSNSIDEIDEDIANYEKVNTGIAVVTPITKLAEIFSQEKITKYEKQFTQKS